MAPVGSIDIEHHTHGPLGDAKNGALHVSEVWSPAENAVELSADMLDGHVVLTDPAAFELAVLLLKATQPADIPGNGSEAWEERIRTVPGRVLGEPDTRTASQRLADVRATYERMTGERSPL
jgi:hypothetical protein